HSVLRTTFHWERLEEPVQVVHASVGLSIERIDYRGAPGSEFERFNSFLVDDRSRGLKLDTAPLMRITLIRVGSDSWRFVWLVHHLILDRWSIDRMMAEFSNAYEALIHGTSVDLRP